MQPQAIRIEYTQMPGKNIGLHIHGLTLAAYEDLKGYINRNAGWRDEPEHEAFKRANLFFQSDSYGALQNGGKDAIKDDPESYLFLEFWSEPEKHADCALKILARLRQLAPDCTMKPDEAETLRLHQSRRFLQEAFAEAGLESAQIPFAVLMRLADKLGEAASAPLRDALHVMLPAINMALSMGAISGPAPMIEDIHRGHALAHRALRAENERRLHLAIFERALVAERLEERIGEEPGSQRPKQKC